MQAVNRPRRPERPDLRRAPPREAQPCRGRLFRRSGQSGRTSC